MENEQLQHPEKTYDHTWFRNESLRLAEQQLTEQTYPGYPHQSERLYIEPDVLEFFEPVTLPLGTWELSGGALPTILEQRTLAAMGNHRFDVYGRPLHPWFDQMVTNPRIGVVTGKGYYWNWGPNRTADPIVVRRDLDKPHVLLIERGDGTGWALPGGFVDNDELATAAAVREAREETGINLAALRAQGTVTYQGPVADLRMTAHAWAETTAVLFELPDESAQQLTTQVWQGGDDAKTATWVPITDLNERLFGSHRLLIAQAMQKF